MSKETFLNIGFMKPNLEYVREPIALVKRVDIAVNWLDTGNSYHSVGEMFGVAQWLRASKIFRQT